MHWNDPSDAFSAAFPWTTFCRRSTQVASVHLSSDCRMENLVGCPTAVPSTGLLLPNCTSLVAHHCEKPVATIDGGNYRVSLKKGWFKYLAKMKNKNYRNNGTAHQQAATFITNISRPFWLFSAGEINANNLSRSFMCWGSSLSGKGVSVQFHKFLHRLRRLWFAIFYQIRENNTKASLRNVKECHNNKKSECEFSRRRVDRCSWKGITRLIGWSGPKMEESRKHQGGAGSHPLCCSFETVVMKISFVRE